MFGGASVGEGRDVHDAVESQVGAELLEDDRLRLKGQHGALLTRQLTRQRDGVDAHVGAHFNHHASIEWAGQALGMAQQLKQDLDFMLATLTVTEERLAHVEVIGIDEHDAVASGGELVGRDDLRSRERVGHGFPPWRHGWGRFEEQIVGGV